MDRAASEPEVCNHRGFMSLNKNPPAGATLPAADGPTLKILTSTFFRIGNTTFGGGYVTIGMLAREFVERRRWLSSADFDLAFALARVTPGTNSIAFCAAVGSLMRGWVGALAAVLASTLPSALLAVI